MVSETWDGFKVDGLKDTTTLSLCWLVEFERNGEYVSGVLDYMSIAQATEYYAAMREDEDVDKLKMSRSLKRIYCGWDHSNWVDVTEDLKEWYQSKHHRPGNGPNQKGQTQ